MKKIALLFLCLLLALSLFGCSGSISDKMILTVNNEENGFGIQTYKYGTEIDPVKFTEENKDAVFIPSSIQDKIELEYKILRNMSVGLAKGNLVLRESGEEGKYVICGYSLTGEGNIGGLKLRDDGKKVVEMYKEIEEFQDVVLDFGNTITVVYLEDKILSIDEFKFSVYPELEKVKTEKELNKYLNSVMVATYRFHDNKLMSIYYGDYNCVVNNR